MDEKARRQIHTYFTGFPHWTFAILTVGFIIIMAAHGVLGYMVGIGALLASGTVGVLWFKSRPAEAQMDLWLREDLAALQPRALTKANLIKDNTVRDSVVVLGFRFRDVGGAASAFVAAAMGGRALRRWIPRSSTLRSTSSSSTSACST